MSKLDCWSKHICTISTFLPEFTNSRLTSAMECNEHVVKPEREDRLIFPSQYVVLLIYCLITRCAELEPFAVTRTR